MGWPTEPKVSFSYFYFFILYENSIPYPFPIYRSSRQSRYVWEKYRSILEGKRLLDVGADACHLKGYLSPGTTYWGVGMGGNPDQQVNLETDKLPFDDRSFDTVLCLDVLEHIENPNEILDHLCRVAREYVIIALPNPLGSLWEAMHFGPYKEGQLTKFYGLPTSKPSDRHKWFFGTEGTRKFIAEGARRNGFELLQMDHSSVHVIPKGWKGIKIRWAMHILFHPSFNLENLLFGTAWMVLRRGPSS